MKEKSAEENVTLTIDGKAFSYPKDTPYSVIADDFRGDYPHDIVMVTADGKLNELHHAARKDAVLTFLTTADTIGHETYLRSCSMLFLWAANEVAGKEKIRRIMLHFSVDHGFFFSFEGGPEIDGTLLQKIEKKMKDGVKKSLPITKRSVTTNEAIELFSKYGMHDKEQLFGTRLASRVNLYRIGDYEDYFYGYMTNSTGFLKYFKLYPYQDGIVLQMPSKNDPEMVPPFKPQDKLFRSQIRSEIWASKMGVDTIATLNKSVIDEKSRETILIAEALQESNISLLADEICKRKKVKFVMIAGPSSSGKTTFSQRLIIQLRTKGLRPHYVGVDNYFVNRDSTPVDENGKKDYECLEALDVKGFNEDMTHLLSGGRVDMPVYDFVEGRRTYKGNYLQLADDEILVIEGIHCLNDEFSYSLPEESKYKVYISALTQLNVDEHNRIPSTDGRLLRRIVRDNRTRGYTASVTLSMWESVRKGEEKHIFPYQEKADFIFNSALLYELSVMKLYVQPLLFQVGKDDPQYLEARRLLKFLDYVLCVPSDDVPHNSILREFIGGGCFHL